MFRFWSLSADPEGIAGTIKVRRDPRRTGQIFSIIKDVDGRSWELKGQVGQYVLARPYNSYEHSPRSHSSAGTETPSSLFVRHRSYAIEVI